MRASALLVRNEMGGEAAALGIATAVQRMAGYEWSQVCSSRSSRARGANMSRPSAAVKSARRPEATVR